MHQSVCRKKAVGCVACFGEGVAPAAFCGGFAVAQKHI